MHHTRRNEEHVARVQRARRLARDLELQRAFEHVAKLLAGMGVLASRAAGDEFRYHLHGVAIAPADVLILHHLAGESGLLRVKREAEHGQCERQEPSFHPASPR